MEDLRILHLEDNELDSELIRASLEQEGLAPRVTRVDTRDGFMAQLREGAFDLIVSDFSLPAFDGLSALKLVRDVDRAVPFIFVSGTIGEERAVAALRNGATDYILKDRLSRLPAAIRRSVAERRDRLARSVAEDRIREQAALLDAAREAIIVHSLDRQVTYWSRGAELLYGWTAAEAQAGEAKAVIPPESRAQVTAAMEAVCSGDKWDGTLAVQARDGRRLLVDSHWTCLRTPDGAPRAILTISSDVTQQREMAAQLLQKERLETIGMVAGGIAHDLNNVLSPLMLGIDSLRRRVTDEKGVRMLQTMEETAQRGAEILQQVLSFARGSSLPIGPVDIGELVRGMERLLASTLSSGITLDIEIAEGLAQPRVDRAQLQQVLLNLCVNARDAMPEGGRLTLEARNAPAADGSARVVLRVTDTGHGMAPEVRQRIFDSFYTTKATGTGIGLATVLAIIQRHGGSIEVDSVLGQGTEFRVFLPVGATPDAKAAPMVGEGRLLVVLDEGSIREISRQTLEAYGYRVVCPTDADGLAAELAARGSEVAAVIVNISLWGDEAGHLIRQVLDRAPTVKVITTSREESAPFELPVLPTVLPQPYSPQTLVEVVGRALSE